MQSKWWMWNQKGRPTGWNLRQELTLQSWGKISSSSRKPQVLLFRPLTDWTKPPQYWGWSPLLQFWGWCESHPLNTFIATSRRGFDWTTRDWPGKALTETWSPQFLSNFFSLKSPDFYTVVMLCSPFLFALNEICEENKWGLLIDMRCCLYIIERF